MAELSTYRGYTISREKFGHVNVWTERGFVGGYSSMAAAHGAVDDRLDAPVAVRVGPRSYALVPPQYVVEYRPPPRESARQARVERFWASMRRERASHHAYRGLLDGGARLSWFLHWDRGIDHGPARDEQHQLVADSLQGLGEWAIAGMVSVGRMDDAADRLADRMDEALDGSEVLNALGDAYDEVHALRVFDRAW